VLRSKLQSPTDQQLHHRQQQEHIDLALIRRNKIPKLKVEGRFWIDDERVDRIDGEIKKLTVAVVENSIHEKAITCFGRGRCELSRNWKED
jgi:hypothetical protein